MKSFPRKHLPTFFAPHTTRAPHSTGGVFFFALIVGNMDKRGYML